MQTIQTIVIASAIAMLGLVAMPTYAENSTSTATTTATSTVATTTPVATSTATSTPTATSTATTTTNLSCVQNAVSVRETTIANAFIAFASTQTTALNARKNALVNAWSIANRKDRRRAIAQAWKEYGTAERAARRTLRESRDSAWKTFRSSTRSCKVYDSEPRHSENWSGFGL